MIDSKLEQRKNAFQKSIIRKIIKELIFSFEITVNLKIFR